MVERRDADGAVKGLAQGEDLPRFALGRDVARKNLPIIPQSFRGREAKHVERPADFVAGLLQTKAGLARDELGEFLSARLDGRAGSLQDGGTLEPRRRPGHRTARLDRGFRVRPST